MLGVRTKELLTAHFDQTRTGQGSTAQIILTL